MSASSCFAGENDEVAGVVIGRNEGKRLESCLRSLLKDVTFLVYVDSGSNDGSVEIANGLGASIVELRKGPYTAARARNEGFFAVRNIRPEIRMVQFVDGDCTIASGWIRTATNYLRAHPEVAVVCGRRREENPAATIYNRLCDIEWNTPIGEAAACGGDSLVKIEALGSVDGFTAYLIAGEEPELCLRLREKGWKIWRLDEEMTLHDAEITHLRQWWRRATRFGYGAAEVSLLHWKSRDPLWKNELLRSVLWGFFLPLLICVMGALHPVFLGTFAIYPLQVARIAIRRGGGRVAWAYGFLVTLSKFAEFLGLAKFLWLKLNRRSGELIEYKML